MNHQPNRYNVCILSTENSLFKKSYLEICCITYEPEIMDKSAEAHDQYLFITIFIPFAIFVANL